MKIRVYKNDCIDEYECESWSVKEGDYLCLCKNKVFNIKHCTDIINMRQAINIEIDSGEN